jgi:ABC-type multidrug transport system ATPase subunit
MTAILKLEQLSKAYGPLLALDGLDLELRAGEVLALLGPNGSGKTTAIRCCAGLLQPNGGSICIAGHDLRKHYREARRQFSYLPQQAHFPANLSVGEAIAFHAALRGLRAADWQAALGLVGLDQGVWPRLVGQLSGGMRQRLALAVASLGNAPLVLLDEPTANLDPEAALHFRSLAKSWRASGRSLLLSTHVLSDVEELADRVIVLVAGKVVAEESIAELRLRLSRFARLRVNVGRAQERHREAAMANGALDVQLNCSNVLVTAPVERRLQILETLAKVGAVQHFETEKPALEDIYMEYVHGRQVQSGAEAQS